MKTLKIFNQYNTNKLQRLVMSIKDSKPLEFNPKFNPNHIDYGQPLKLK